MGLLLLETIFYVLVGFQASGVCSVFIVPIGAIGVGTLLATILLHVSSYSKKRNIWLPVVISVLLATAYQPANHYLQYMVNTIFAESDISFLEYEIYVANNTVYQIGRMGQLEVSAMAPQVYLDWAIYQIALMIYLPWYCYRNLIKMPYCKTCQRMFRKRKMYKLYCIKEPSEAKFKNISWLVTNMQHQRGQVAYQVSYLSCEQCGQEFLSLERSDKKDCEHPLLSIPPENDYLEYAQEARRQSYFVQITHPKTSLAVFGGLLVLYIVTFFSMVHFLLFRERSMDFCLVLVIVGIACPGLWNAIIKRIVLLRKGDIPQHPALLCNIASGLASVITFLGIFLAQGFLR